MKGLKSFYKSVMLIVLTATITFIVTGTLMYNKYGEELKKETEKITYVPTQDNISRTFESYHKYISSKYLYDMDEKKMIESALKGYVEGLGDPYSEYIAPDQMKEFMETTTGNYVGIGAYLIADTETDHVVVLKPIKGSPAEEVGLKAGDIISKIDGVEYKANQLEEAANTLKQEEGTKVNLEIIRNDDVLNIEITRRKVKINHVETEVFEDSIGYISILSIDENTSDEFKDCYNELKEKGVKSLIIDLRDNGGGIVDEAIAIADMMVEKGKPILTILSKSEENQIITAKTDKEIDLPIIVLINKGTASSAELLAAAIRENNENVTLLGSQTFGKGVIQTIFTLNDGSGLKLTTNEYLGPNNKKVNNRGISPDVVLRVPEDPNVEGIDSTNDVQLEKAIEILKEKN